MPCHAIQCLSFLHRCLCYAGGLFAGHDYYNNAEMQAVSSDQDWALCADGTRKEGAVKGAVNTFAAQHNLIIGRTEETFPSWFTVKPCSGALHLHT